MKTQKEQAEDIAPGLTFGDPGLKSGNRLISEFKSLALTLALTSGVYDYEYMDTDLGSCVDFLSHPGMSTITQHYRYGVLISKWIVKIRPPSCMFWHSCERVKRIEGIGQQEWGTPHPESPNC